MKVVIMSVERIFGWVQWYNDMIFYDGYGCFFFFSNIVVGGFWEGKVLFFCVIQIVVCLGS